MATAPNTEQQELQELGEMYDEAVARAEELATHAESSQPDYVPYEGDLTQRTDPLRRLYQHLYDARDELLALRTRLLYRMGQLGEHDAPALRRWLVRRVVRAQLLIAENCVEASETAEGYQFVDAARRGLTKQRDGAALSPADFEALEKRSTAAVPDFSGIRFPPLREGGDEAPVSFANIDLLADCVCKMGSAWSGWGAQEHALRCFDVVERLHSHWRGAQGVSGLADMKQQIQALLDESSQRQEAARRVLDREREEQLDRRAAILAEKRRRRGLRQPDDDAASTTSRAESSVGPLADALADAAAAAAAPTDLDPSPPTAAELADVRGAMEARFTAACNGLAQLHRFAGRALESCHYCHLTLQRQLEGSRSRGSLDWKAWGTNCLALSEFYLIVRDLSHAEHCIAAVGVLVSGPPRDGDAAGAELAKEHDFARARWHYHAAKLLHAEAAALAADGAAEPASLEGVRVRLWRNEHYPPPPEEAARLVADAELRGLVDRRKAFKLPVAPPRAEIVCSAAEVARHIDAAAALYRAACAADTVDDDCERHLHAHLELADLLATQHYFIGAGPAAAAARGANLQQRVELLQRIVDDGLDELVFRNVLRQAHFGLGALRQEQAELLLELGRPPAEYVPHLERSASHWTRFSERFLHEFAELQKVREPHQRHALLRLDGSDAPAYVVGEMRHARTLALFPDAPVPPILAKYKGVVRFVETNAEATQEYPELQAHAAQCKEMIALLQRRLRAAAAPAAAAPAPAAAAVRHADPAVAAPAATHEP